MLHLKHMGEYAYKGGGKKHGSFDKYWQVAVYEARPIHGKGSKVKRPNTTTGTLSKRKNITYEIKYFRFIPSYTQTTFSIG